MVFAVVIAEYASSVPLCVDMDGTLFRSDALWEGLLAMLQRRPFTLARAPLWMFRGRAYFKRQVAAAATCPAETLPYRASLLEWLRSEGERRKVVLCTAADADVAQRVADHLGVFDEVICSDGVRNLKGAAKAQRLVERFGAKAFDYVGNDACDLEVWAQARRAYVVGATPALAERARTVAEVAGVIDERTTSPQAWVRALRVYQWVKNLLLFLPLVTAHLVGSASAWFAATLAFVAFGLLASSAYVLNDLVDLHADRQHPRKRERPFASGEIPIQAGLVAVPLLITGAAALAAFLPPLFGLTLGLYFAVTLAYSFLLKRIAVLDVVALAGLYTLRVIAGTFALGLTLSFWLLAFSMFTFLSLALVKRFAELDAARLAERKGAVGRGYAVEDLPIIGSMGTASGYLSVLVLALYINSTASAQLYTRPVALWLLCPLLLYWISRIWLITHRGEMHDDPILFAARDRTSFGIALLGLGVVLVAL